MALYLKLTESIPVTKFDLEEPCIDGIQKIIEKLGPRGIIESLPRFELNCPGFGSNDSVTALAFRAKCFERQYLQCEAGNVKTCPLIFDTGASSGLTPYRSDFMNDYKPVSIPVKGVAGGGQIVGTGTILRKFKSRCGEILYIPSHGYHMPDAQIRLESPQSLIRALGTPGHAKLSGWDIEWHQPDGKIIDIPIDHATNLPLMRNFVCSNKEKADFGPSYNVALSSSGGEDSKMIHDLFNNCEEKCTVRCCTSVLDETNQNLTNAQKELLEWHQKLCINMHDLLQLMKPQNVKNQKGDVIFERPPIVNCKFKVTPRLTRGEFPMCLSCKLATSKRRSPEVKTSKLLASKTGNLSRDCYEPGDQINTDQFNVQTPGRLCSGYGRDTPENSYHGGTIFQDSASNLVRV